MAEEAARNRQHAYTSYANLVLSSDRRGRGDNEPTGEAETIWGRMQGRMGDKAGTREGTKPKELEERLEKLRARKERREKKKKEGKVVVDKKRKSKLAATLGNETIVSEGFNVAMANYYEPKTRETRAAYEVVLAILAERIGDVQQDVLRNAADEILAFLKDDRLTDVKRQELIGTVIGKVNNDEFARLVNLGKMITDFVAGGATSTATATGESKMDDEHGLAVVLDDDSSESSGSVDFVVHDDTASESSSGGGGGVETTTANVLQTTGGGEDGGDVSAMDLDAPLDPKSIDAHWLQRTIAGYVEEAVEAQQLSVTVLDILENAVDPRDCESRLVDVLGFKMFNLVKMVMRNRDKIVYCIRLAQADDSERERIAQEMQNSAALLPIWNALQGIDDGAGGKRGKRGKKGGSGGAAGSGAGDGAGDGSGATNLEARRVVDLEDLAFERGGHMMTNQNCELPEGSYRTQGKGYEEIHIPGVSPREFDEDERLKPISTLPEWVQPAFGGYETLNRVQSRMYEAAFQRDENILLCAPTGAGKTNVALMCILHELAKYRDDETGVIDKDAFKVVYIAPMKSLVQEMVGNFSSRLEPFGIQVRELTGDSQLTKQQIYETQVIVSTPEKWDIITRKSGDRTYTQLVRLVIIDEVHLLHDDRGPVLESIVSRTIRNVEATQELTRIVGLSATLPNYRDVATFLRVDMDSGLFHFDGSFRPCPLQQVYVGITEKKPLKRYNLMNEICFEKVSSFAGKHQVLVFVHSRKDTAKTARYLRDEALATETLSNFLKADSSSRMILTQMADDVKNEDLRDLLPYGFAMHHAGMTREDRTLVEDLFAAKHIQVLVSTATLAWGVNLPAHTVIIKGTQVYSPEKGRWVELSPLDVMQMMGRAGRPGFDTHGEGILITTHTELQYYLSLLNQQLPIESQFIKSLADNLNAEIVLGTIRNVEEAVTWLGYTYLYIRMLRNPRLYGMMVDVLDDDPALRQRRIDIIHSAATLLAKGSLIKYDRKSGNFAVTDLGVVASHFYIAHDSMAVYAEHLRPTLSDIDLFRVFALSKEFKFIVVRQEEKLELTKLLERVPIPVKETVEDPTAKVNVLLQAYISHLRLEGFALLSDMVYVTQSAGRIMRALYEVVAKRGWALMSHKILALCKMIDKRMWGSQTPLRQFAGIPEEILAKIEKKDFPWVLMYDLSPQDIGELIRFPKMGRTIYRFVHQFPKLDVEAHVLPITRSVLKVELTITPDFMWNDKVHGHAEPWHIFVEDVDGEDILHQEYFLLKKRFAEVEHTVSFFVPIYEPVPPQYFVRIVSDRWLSAETVLPISFRHLYLPHKNMSPTEVLDLQPLPVAGLRNKEYEALYAGSFEFFNPIQTQVFSTLYSTDDNALICAPTGSGKTACAEFAMLRVFSTAASGTKVGKIVYIAPMQALADERLADWQTRFGLGLGKKVVQLTGEIGVDMKLLSRADIVISTPERWDVISRRWKNRKHVKGVELIIVDELHLVGGVGGPTLEIVVSRMRYVAAKLGRHIRVVGLSTSLANARDVGAWIGCSSSNIFNFPTNVRMHPLDIYLQGFGVTSAASRLLAMAKPTFLAVKQRAGDKPCIVFAPDRKQARLAAIDIVTYAASTGDPTAFLHAAPEDLETYLSSVRANGLADVLQAGVGFYHEGLAPDEKKAVADLYRAGAIQVLVATGSMCWGMDLTAHLVVIMDTQRYDGAEHRYVDYPIADMLQMMGRATRPVVDSAGVAVILCEASKKAYYKRFLYEPLPVESHLDHMLADHMCAEVVTKTITSYQDAVNYLTWTLLYRRLTQNPNYYALQGVSNEFLSDHLSTLVEDTIADLEASKAVAIEEDGRVTALNLGLISSYYYIRTATLELFSVSVAGNTKVRGLIEILAAASEYDDIPLRRREEDELERIVQLLPRRFEVKHGDVHAKASILLQAHFSRIPLNSDLAADQRLVLNDIVRLIHALVDVISSQSSLKPALAAMEICQMVVQAVWTNRDSYLKQLPHFSEEVLARCEAAKVDSVFDILDLEDDVRNDLLRMDQRQMSDVARACNRYPALDCAVEVEDAGDLHEGELVTMVVDIEREGAEDGFDEPVAAPFFPKPKDEQWWIVLGDRATNALLAIKRVVIGAELKHELEFVAPQEGSFTYMLYLVCDSYAGADQEFEVDVTIGPALSDDEASGSGSGSGSDDDVADMQT